MSHPVRHDEHLPEKPPGSSKTGSSVVVIDRLENDPKQSSADRYASHGGSGILEMLEVINLLRTVSVTCCMVGVAALRYYGAGRVLKDWEVCVPCDQLQKATHILTCHSHGQSYRLSPPGDIRLYSLHHTFPRFKVQGVWLNFYLVPSDTCRLDCTPSNIEHSQSGLPYPKLKVFAQSLLETMSAVDLTDLVDGMDLDETWGKANLDLEGTQDIDWAEATNERILASRPDAFLALNPTQPCLKKDVWEEIVRTKGKRIGLESPPGLLVTKFRIAGEGDPRLMDRNYV